MVLNSENYARQMQALLPRGRVWQAVASRLENFLLGASLVLETLGGRARGLLAEFDPTRAVELLPDYEAELDITTADTADAERTARVIARLVQRQRFRPVDFQAALAPLLGLAPAQVVIIERTAAFAAAIGDVREIFRFFVYRDPTLPGECFLEAAQAQLDRMKPAHTAGHVIESINFLCDDEHSLTDRDLLGA